MKSLAWSVHAVSDMLILLENNPKLLHRKIDRQQ